jgi:hypothetical protein
MSRHAADAAGMSKVAAAVLFWAAVGLLQKFNWGLGVWKALVLAALLAAVPLVVAQAERGGAAAGGSASRLLKAAVLALLLAHTGYAALKLRHPSLIDAATITIAEGQGLRAGANPYAAERDAEAAAGTHDARFGGYKYLPVTLAAYLPLGALGPRGVVLTNLLLQFAVVALIFRLGMALASATAGWLAMLLYLSLPLVPFQLFAKGALDLVAVVPLLAALLLVARGKPALGGLCLGLSLAAKLLPGALLLPSALPARSRDRLRYAAGIAMGLLPVVPFALWAPAAFLDNIVLFNLVRPVDSTSWLFAFPGARPVAAAAMAALYLAALAVAWLRPPATLARRSGMAVALILATLLAAPAVHHNYQLWWLPLACALLGAALAPGRLPSGAPAATKAPLGSI